jgi:hypothetical protein
MKKDTGQVEEVEEYRNSWGGFARIWDSIYDAYLKNPNDKFDGWMDFSGKNSKKLWALWKDPKVPKWIRQILTSTFDYAIVERERLNEYANLLDKFVDNFPVPDQVDHLADWAKEARKLAEDENCVGICFHGTSCGDNLWLDNHCMVTVEDFEKKFGFTPEKDGEDYYGDFENDGYYEEAIVEEGEERQLNVWFPYNINKQYKHFFVFEELDKE